MEKYYFFDFDCKDHLEYIESHLPFIHIYSWEDGSCVKCIKAKDSLIADVFLSLEKYCDENDLPYTPLVIRETIPEYFLRHQNQTLKEAFDKKYQIIQQ